MRGAFSNRHCAMLSPLNQIYPMAKGFICNLRVTGMCILCVHSTLAFTRRGTLSFL